jgi:hypothetical protein
MSTKGIRTVLTKLADLCEALDAVPPESALELKRTLDRIHDFVEGESKRNPLKTRVWTADDTGIVEAIIENHVKSLGVKDRQDAKVRTDATP